MEHGCGSVRDGELVVAGGESSPLLGEVEGALHDVAASVGHFVEGWWPSAGRAFALTCCDLAGLLRDDRLDPARGQHAPVHAAGVGAVGHHDVGARAWTSRPRAGHANVGQHLGQHRAVVALPAGDHQRQRPAVAVDRGVDLAGQPATGAAHAVTCGFSLTAQRAGDEPHRLIRVTRSSPLCPARGAQCSCRAGEPG